MWSSLEGLFIGGRYEICRHIATGGMAAVFRGWDHRVERPVAIKVLRQLEHADQPAIARFRREAHAAAMLQHPNVVRAYDFFEDSGCYYLVMEYIDGINLKQHLKRRGPLPADEALEIAGQVCAALRAAHAHGFIHRDIKPQNILMDPQGVAKVTDFGVVHITRGTTLTTDGVVLGTADYIAPEQARGEPLSPATDLYSLGVVLYEMLTGRVPFTGPTPMAVAALHASVPVPPPRRIATSLSPYVEALVLRALRKDPAERYASAAAMSLAIRGAQQAPAACADAVEPAARAEPADAAAVAVGAASPVLAGAAVSQGAVQSALGTGQAVSGAPASGAQVAARVEVEVEVEEGAGARWGAAAPQRQAVTDGGAPLMREREEARPRGAGDDHSEGGAEAVMMPLEPVAPWLRAMVSLLTILALLAATFALDAWLRAHGGAAGIFSLP
jgi:hypothetical protein